MECNLSQYIHWDILEPNEQHVSPNERFGDVSSPINRTRDTSEHLANHVQVLCNVNLQSDSTDETWDSSFILEGGIGIYEFLPLFASSDLHTRSAVGVELHRVVGCSLASMWHPNSTFLLVERGFSSGKGWCPRRAEWGQFWLLTGATHPYIGWIDLEKAIVLADPHENNEISESWPDFRDDHMHIPRRLVLQS
jgi:hypothetical protein